METKKQRGGIREGAGRRPVTAHCPICGEVLRKSALLDHVLACTLPTAPTCESIAERTCPAECADGRDLGSVGPDYDLCATCGGRGKVAV